MCKLLHAGYARMFRNKTLLICLGILAYTNGLNLIFNALHLEEPDKPDSFLFSGLMIVSIMAAVFISSFLGAEHRFGTIRNKLIIGQSRTKVYFSSFLVCLTGVMTMFGLVWILTLVVGNLFLGGFVESSQQLGIAFLCSFLAMTVLTALYTLFVLCIHSKSKSSVAAVITAFMMLMTSVVAVQMLSEPEFCRPEEIMLAEEMDITLEPAPDDPSLVCNPNYVSAGRRKVYEAIDTFCPTSWILTVADNVSAKTVLIPSAEIILLLGAGLYIFKKRDLK